MKAATHTDVIDVQALRVGMFVHLDVGWMSHPFPLSSFRITTAAQVATIRSLGLKRVRWSPQQSDLAALETGDAEAALAGEPAAANDDDGAERAEPADDAVEDAPPDQDESCPEHCPLDGEKERGPGSRAQRHRAHSRGPRADQLVSIISAD